MTTPIRLAIAGLGAIGLKVARAVDAGRVPGVCLTAVSAKDKAAATARLADLAAPPKVMDLSQLAERYLGSTVRGYQDAP